jgi:hypothetical protein
MEAAWLTPANAGGASYQRRFRLARALASALQSPVYDIAVTRMQPLSVQEWDGCEPERVMGLQSERIDWVDYAKGF